MMLLLHIIVALGSLAFTIYLLFSPTRAKLGLSCGLVVLTIASGTFLVITQPAHILQACVSGLVYISITLAMLALATRRIKIENTA